jgi:dihydroorotase
MTTVLDMPNNEPVTMSAYNLKNRMQIAERTILTNVGFYSEFPQNMKEMGRIAREGAVAFKLFLTQQIGGLDIDDDSAIIRALKTAGRLNLPVALHAEDKTLLKAAETEFKNANRNDTDAFLEAHKEHVEVKAINRLLELSAESDVRLHFCHVSTERGLKAIVEAKESGKPLTCEVTPHHLFLSVDDLRRIGSLALTMPPIREKRHSRALWKGIKSGWIDVTGSDHAPHSREEKNANSVWDVKVGIPGLETTLPLLLTAVKHRRLSMSDLVRLMSEAPARIFGLRSKGFLKAGNDADLTVVDLHRTYKIDASKFLSKAKFSPFDGWIVEGKPVKTFVGGNLVMDDGAIVAEPGCGEVIRGNKS